MEKRFRDELILDHMVCEQAIFKLKKKPRNCGASFNLRTDYFTRSFRALPALNFGALEAAILIFSPVAGLTPMRAPRSAT